MVWILDRKNFSHSRTKFPSSSGPLGSSTHERMGELEAEQVVTIHVGYPHGAGTQDS